ncbi:hypothetical protein ABB37_03170 [Leptomonas pyrrhocoris]|uniref:Uncharacterized protein n=1 Tax=Leptomonas pyrrhocoris TaxID=157538 RepID=A0A0M9G4C2_LEPPY|nr:hypothetical protein ABB37_03170 [Leptomonas pyrrhocoris]KPA81987.1 hypothetical protein ABB37_03170 [Leptomonas pyrrhocoris]|eukprot:XP_015660426.1 hypothetical protein ABB37_03170 [Leptomonas pyrrhocoris]
MSLCRSTEEGSVLQSSSTFADDSRKRSRSEHDSVAFDDGDNSDGGYGNSINPLFLVSGPRGGAISAHSADAELEALADLVDDGVYHVLREAWEEVAVPADTYWSCPTHLYAGDATAALLRRHAAATPPKSLPLRIPHPRQLLSSFYPARVEALTARGYQPHRGLVPVALDRKGGKGSKMFNVLARWEVEANTTSSARGEEGEGKPARPPHRTSAIAKFVDAIPRPTDRSIYVLVDEECPVDPYFDVDLAFNAAVDDSNRLSVLRQDSDTRGLATLDAAAVEKALLTILSTLRSEVEIAWSTQVEECLVLTSSVQFSHQPSTAAASSLSELEEVKLSFHVHFRLTDRAAVESVRELHAFAVALRAKLQRTQLDGAKEKDENAKRAALLLECVDFGVYTRWRAFRLPYNVKAPDSHGAGKPLAEGAGDELLAEQLGQLGISLPDVHVGSAAPAVIHSVVYATDIETQKQQRYLVGKLMLYCRYLLPLLPGLTRFATAELKDFLAALIPKEADAALTVQSGGASSSSASAVSLRSSKDVISAWVLDMACIIRDASELATEPQSKATTTEGEEEEKEKATASGFRLLRYQPTATDPAALAKTTASPFDIPMPPMPRSVRVRVDDKNVKKLLAEVFWCVAPEYKQASKSAGTNLEAQLVPSAAITPERINAQYEEAIRAYYVFQKQSKFCMRLQRIHKATYVQLYLTFGSIKIRCYSNDCCDRCCVIPWEAPENPKSVPQHHKGYPKFDRLAEIHRSLFPPLPAGELVRRYGTAVLHQQQQ